MKIIKNKLIFAFLFILFFITTTVSFNNKVYASDDEKLNTFIATSIDKGYLNSTLEIIQTSNHKYDINFLVKENILGINYGFYLTPSVVESLTSVGFECETFVDQQYAYSVFTTTTKNLGEVAARISVLPYIDLDYYIDKDTKEQIITGKFQEDFFKEERKSNEMLDTLFGSNLIAFKFKPLSDDLFSSNAPLKDKDGFYLWVYSQENNSNDFSGLIKPTPVIVNILAYTAILLVVGILVFLVIKLINKKNGKNKKDYNNYDNYDNGYNNNYNYDNYNNY